MTWMAMLRVCVGPLETPLDLGSLAFCEDEALVSPCNTRFAACVRAHLQVSYSIHDPPFGAFVRLCMCCQKTGIGQHVEGHMATTSDTLDFRKQTRDSIWNCCQST